MITFKKFGKTIKIRNDDWKKLGERFEAGKARWDGERSAYFIHIACSLCERYECGACPFSQFGGNRHGCTMFLEKLIKSRKFSVGKLTLSWEKQNHKIARKQLGQLLKMMDKIEASQ